MTAPRDASGSFIRFLGFRGVSFLAACAVGMAMNTAAVCLLALDRHIPETPAVVDAGIGFRWAVAALDVPLLALVLFVVHGVRKVPPRAVPV